MATQAQTTVQKAATAAKNSNNKTTATTQLPYNRLLQSAGKVITYGDPELENHALDVVVIPGKNLVAVEDRYGLALINTTTNEVETRWRYADHQSYKNLVSTYSGITTFTYKKTTWLAWSAQGGKAGEGLVMIAELENDTLTRISDIPFLPVAPAKVALPNQVVAHVENGIPFLYVVLNGNNQLAKINFETRHTEWTTTTGEAPFGICIVQNKAYVTNWAGPTATDTSLETAGIPWGSAYTNPVTGATRLGSVSVIDITNGTAGKEIPVGLHPNAMVSSPNGRFLYVANANSDNVSVINISRQMVTDSVSVGLFSHTTHFYGSSPNGLCIAPDGKQLFVANGLDNAVAVVQLGSHASAKGLGRSQVSGFIPTEAYPSGIAFRENKLYVTNLEAKGAGVLSPDTDLKEKTGSPITAFTIHKQLASVSVIGVPPPVMLKDYTQKVKQLNLSYRMVASFNLKPRKNIAPKPVPDRIGEPSVFKHVVYIIKENKTYDQVYGDIAEGNGDSSLCVYGKLITPNQHALTAAFSLLDNYYASGKSSAEGHQWTDAAMVSDYVEKNVRAWFRSYPHRQDDALVYNKSGFIWNDAMDAGKKVRIFGEACKTHYDTKMKWLDIYNRYIDTNPLPVYNTTTIARIRPIIEDDYPDCDNFIFTDQLRSASFIKEWKQYEQQPGDSVPDLIVLSLPNDHTAGTSPDFPTPRAMVADNDLALGKIIETIAGSRFWDSTVVFVTEDDSQSGWDHVSPYRTTGIVISPYSELQTTVHTNYNQTCMVRTIEQILGIPAMNIIDATARPMYDCFARHKTKNRYQVIPNNIALNEMNKPLAALHGRALYYAKLSKNEAFKELDSGDDNEMNHILWFDAKGFQPYPTRK